MALHFMLLSVRKETGFTLIEIMLTTVIVTVGAMLLMEGLSTNTAADVDTEKVRASMKHGILTIHLPKTERLKTKTIKVREVE